MKVHRVPYQGQWLVIGEDELQRLPRDAQLTFREYIEAYEWNKLSFFLPHGGGKDFINDRLSEVVFLSALNRAGKTIHGVAKMLFQILPCDPEWTCFTKHGIKFHEWEGPVRAAVACHKMAHLERLIWPLILEFAPRNEIIDYIPVPGSKAVRSFSIRQNPTVKFACGSILDMFTYSQEQAVFTALAYKYIHWDENPKEEQFDEGDARMLKQVGEESQQWITLTANKLKGREDTGIKGWASRMMDGSLTKGHTVKVYNITVDQVPNCIFSDAKKKSTFRKWVTEPKERGDLKAQREGEARYYGKPQRSGGLIFDNFIPEVHIIDPFEIPKDWTKERAIDHGESQPACCLWRAFAPDCWSQFIYREYYEPGRVIAQHAPAIIAASGNTRSETDEFVDELTGLTWKIWQEDFIRESYFKTVMDARSFNNHQVGRTIGDLYAMYGLRSQPACTDDDETQFARIRNLLNIDPDRQHYVTKAKGAPQLYIFRSCFNLIREVVDLEIDDVTDKPKRSQPVHAVDALKFVCSERTRYMGESWKQEEKDDGQGAADPYYTGAVRRPVTR